MNFLRLASITEFSIKRSQEKFKKMLHETYEGDDKEEDLDDDI